MECDSYRCQAIIAANETHSAEAYLYFREWKETMADPRVYYPELMNESGGDPRARSIGCTGAAQQQNPQLVSANFMAASLAQHLYVLWAMELPRMEGWMDILPSMPHKLNANLSRLETHKLEDKYQTKGHNNANNTNDSTRGGAGRDGSVPAVTLYGVTCAV